MSRCREKENLTVLQIHKIALVKGVRGGADLVTLGRRTVCKTKAKGTAYKHYILVDRFDT